MTARTGPGTIRLGVLGFFGLGNLGNEGSLTALLDQLRSADADVDVRCFAGNPEAARREHVIACTALMSHRSRPGAGGPLETVRKACGRLVDVPRIWRLVGEVDVVVVPGMGVLEPNLDDANVWGFPYWQFLAALAARLRRRPFVLLSVGVGVPEDRWVRFYFRSTLRLARYCTFRDQGSRSAANRLRGRARPGTVSADLAFALTEPPAPAHPVEGRVVLGVMTPDSRGAGVDVVAVYAEKVSQAIVRLLDRGHTLRLVVGDLADRAVADRIRELVVRQRPRTDAAVLGVCDADTLHALMVEMAQAEVVVASRYHNLVCALKVRRPAVSLGYADKNAELLAEFGLAGYDQPMRDFDVEVLDHQVQELRQQRHALEPGMVRTLERMDAALRDQHRDVTDRILRPLSRS
jgi:polysaccharide pyruvyl transferase WcaK-like protein